MLPTIRKYTPTSFKLTVGIRAWFISYETVVAYCGPNALHGVRRPHPYSRTTSRHMVRMGVRDWQQLSDAEFELRAHISLRD